MAGHLCADHGPYSVWPYINDVIWIVLILSAAIMCWWSNLYGKLALSLSLLFLLAINVEIATGVFPWFGFYAYVF